MEARSIQQFRDVLSDLHKRTQDQKIEWIRVNPTTYSWSNDRGRVNIQVVEQRRLVREGNKLLNRTDKSIALQVFDSDGNSALSINSKEIPELSGELGSLFNLAAEAVLSDGMNVLKGMLN